MFECVEKVILISEVPPFSYVEKFNRYDSIDDDVLRCYTEFSFAAHIYYAMKEGLVSELSARMTAMDGASKNAGKSLFIIT